MLKPLIVPDADLSQIRNIEHYDDIDTNHQFNILNNLKDKKNQK